MASEGMEVDGCAATRETLMSERERRGVKHRWRVSRNENARKRVRERSGAKGGSSERTEKSTGDDADGERKRGRSAPIHQRPSTLAFPPLSFFSTVRAPSFRVTSALFHPSPRVTSGSSPREFSATTGTHRLRLSASRFSLVLPRQPTPRPPFLYQRPINLGHFPVEPNS